MARCVVVLGIHRSGTSATAGVLHHLGVEMGPKLIGPTPANPRGHFEDMDLAQLNDLALGSWSSPVPAVTAWRPQFERHLIDRARSASPFGLKDPRLCLTWEYLEPWIKSLPMVDDVRVVVVSRPFLQSVRSLMRRDGWSRDRAIQIQSIHQYKLVENVERLRAVGTPLMGIEFGRLLNHPQEVVEELAAFCWDGIPGAPGHDARQAAARFIDPQLDREGRSGSSTDQERAA